MKSIIRAMTLTGMATVSFSGGLSAHPGHVTHGGLWHTVQHAVSSPYHTVVILAAVVLAAAGFAAIRPIRAGRRARRQAAEITG